MKSTTETALRDLVDRAAIHDLLMRYARGVDGRDVDLVASCFTSDASYEGALGKGGIDKALAALRERMTRYERTMHFMGNQLIEVSGDRARCETYAIAYHQLNEDGELRNLAVGVRYLDDLVRRGEQWFICNRLVKLEWQRQDKVTLPVAS